MTAIPPDPPPPPTHADRWVRVQQTYQALILLAIIVGTILALLAIYTGNNDRDDDLEDVDVDAARVVALR